jgi:tRNA wybutosine-synthesizing protein 1
MEKILPDQLGSALKKQKYQLIGCHSAVKKCRWLHESLVRGRTCYKEKFFGIKSSQCIQMTPWLGCDCACAFCWRTQSLQDLAIPWNETDNSRFDEAREIAEGSILAQRRILTGYKNHPKVSQEKYLEASNPRHVAISLAGEPTLYPKLEELLKEFHRRRLTTFLVTNGTMPEVLSKMKELPTQLYITLAAPDEKTYQQTCSPGIPDAWIRLNKSLELISSLDCPVVLRLTLARHLNMKAPETYARLIEQADPLYFECKGVVYVGSARKRIRFENMPEHEEIRQFARELCSLTGYRPIAESRDSKVVLASSKLKEPKRLAK